MKDAGLRRIAPLPFVFVILCAAAFARADAAKDDDPVKPLENSDFETSRLRPWTGGGEVVELPDGNHVYEVRDAASATIAQSFRVRGSRHVFSLSFKYRILEKFDRDELNVSIGAEASNLFGMSEKVAVVADGKWHEATMVWDRRKGYKAIGKTPKPFRGEFHLNLRLHGGPGVLQLDDIVLEAHN